MHSTQQESANLAHMSAQASQACACTAQIASAYGLRRDIKLRLSEAMAAQSRASAAHFSRSALPDIAHSATHRSQASIQRIVVSTQGPRILAIFCPSSALPGAKQLQRPSLDLSLLQEMRAESQNR
jgi:hypothetical protein